MKRPEKPNPNPKPYTIDFERRKARGILTCPDDPLYDTEIVMCGKTQKECDAIALEIRNSKDRGPLTDAELVARGAIDVTETGFGIGIMLSRSSSGGKKKK